MRTERSDVWSIARYQAKHSSASKIERDRSSALDGPFMYLSVFTFWTY